MNLNIGNIIEFKYSMNRWLKVLPNYGEEGMTTLLDNLKIGSVIKLNFIDYPNFGGKGYLIKTVLSIQNSQNLELVSNKYNLDGDCYIFYDKIYDEYKRKLYAGYFNISKLYRFDDDVSPEIYNVTFEILGETELL